MQEVWPNSLKVILDRLSNMCLTLDITCGIIWADTRARKGGKISACRMESRIEKSEWTGGELYNDFRDSILDSTGIF